MEAGPGPEGAQEVNWRTCELHGTRSLQDPGGERCSSEEGLVGSEVARWTEVTPQVEVGAGWGQAGRQHDAGA